mmetsp:Transcript_25291/g.65224  ORF Transcript_25291/g.65224 Transcript_25291/m.65224 type:complete len:351 (-) Transcript_25291:182-1234(-)
MRGQGGQARLQCLVCSSASILLRCFWLPIPQPYPSRCWFRACMVHTKLQIIPGNLVLPRQRLQETAPSLPTEPPVGNGGAAGGAGEKELTHLADDGLHGLRQARERHSHSINCIAVTRSTINTTAAFAAIPLLLLLLPLSLLLLLLLQQRLRLRKLCVDPRSACCQKSMQGSLAVKLSQCRQCDEAVGRLEGRQACLCGQAGVHQALNLALELLHHRPLVGQQREARQRISATRRVQQLVHDVRPQETAAGIHELPHVQEAPDHLRRIDQVLDPATHGIQFLMSGEGVSPLIQKVVRRREPSRQAGKFFLDVDYISQDGLTVVRDGDNRVGTANEVPVRVSNKLPQLMLF